MTGSMKSMALECYTLKMLHNIAVSMQDLRPVRLLVLIYIIQGTTITVVSGVTCTRLG